MNLRTALRLQPHAVVAFVGGGGKTSLMFRLAAEIVAGGGRVITTTTTRIFANQIGLAPHHIALADPGLLPAAFAAQLAGHAHVLVTGPVDEAAGKAFGVAPQMVAELLRTGVDAVLVEADGSRMRPLKAPAEHEPVIPACSTHVVAVVGADVFGKLLVEDSVHRADRAAVLANASLGQPVTHEMAAAILAHPLGGRKGVPASAHWTAFINKVESAEQLAAARALAERLLEAYGLPAVLGSARQIDPVCERVEPVAVVILAAGASSRMAALGVPKPLLAWGKGSLLTRAADAALRIGSTQTYVVVGNLSGPVQQVLGTRKIQLVPNERWQAGLSTSVAAALRALNSGTGAAIFLPVDLPHVGTELLAALIALHRSSGAMVVAPRVDGRRANPVLFDRALFPELLEQRGDVGGRAVADKYAAQTEWVDWSADILQDIDTPEDYEALRPAP